MAEPNVEVFDKEAMAFSFVRTSVTRALPKVTNFTSSLDAVPSEFPCVYLRVIDDYDVPGMMTSFHDADPQRVTFQCDVYSQATSGRKAEVKRITREVSRAFKALGFTRITGSFEPQTLVDGQGNTVSWMASRYEATWEPRHGTFCTF